MHSGRGQGNIVSDLLNLIARNSSTESVDFEFYFDNLSARIYAKTLSPAPIHDVDGMHWRATCAAQESAASFLHGLQIAPSRDRNLQSLHKSEEHESRQGYTYISEDAWKSEAVASKLVGAVGRALSSRIGRIAR